MAKTLVLTQAAVDFGSPDLANFPSVRVILRPANGSRPPHVKVRTHRGQVIWEADVAGWTSSGDLHTIETLEPGWSVAVFKGCGCSGQANRAQLWLEAREAARATP